jgi:hypothetical protein
VKRLSTKGLYLYIKKAEVALDRAESRAAARYGWTGQQSGSGFFDIARPALGVFASLDRF